MFCKKFYGYSLSIQQICLSSSCDEPSTNTLHCKEVVYENQGRGSLLLGRTFSNNPKFLLGRSPFSTEDGRPRPILSDVALPPTAQWIGSWEIDDYVMGAGESGWLYSNSWDGPWSHKSGVSSKFRRRKWLRRYVLAAAQSPRVMEAQPNPLFKHGHIDADIVASSNIQNGFADLTVLDNFWFNSEKIRFVEVVLSGCLEHHQKIPSAVENAILCKRTLMRKHLPVLNACKNEA
jgi:hypothetical protein